MKSNGYNSHLASREVGSVGSQMVKTAHPKEQIFLSKKLTKEGYSCNLA